MIGGYIGYAGYFPQLCGAGRKRRTGHDTDRVHYLIHLESRSLEIAGHVVNPVVSGNRDDEGLLLFFRHGDSPESNLVAAQGNG
jgi:hypothetical protein